MTRSLPNTEAEFVVFVNGEERDISAGTTVGDVVALVYSSSSGCAVARNGEVLPKAEWAAIELAPGDVVEILTAAPGG